MKNSVCHVLAFLLMILLCFLIAFLLIQKTLSKNYVLKTLNNIHYYDRVYQNLLTEIDDYIVNEEVKEIYHNYFTKDLLKEDIEIILNTIYLGEEASVSRYADLYQEIEKYNNNHEIDHKYALELNKIYIKNLFPVDEFTLLQKLHFSQSDMWFITIILSFLIMVLGTILYFMSGNLKYYSFSLMGLGIILVLPAVLIRVLSLFDDFLYTNTYFTDFLLSSVYTTKNIMFILGFMLISSVIILKLINKIQKDTCLFPENGIKLYHK